MILHFRGASASTTPALVTLDLGATLKRQKYIQNSVLKHHNQEHQLDNSMEESLSHQDNIVHKIIKKITCISRWNYCDWYSSQCNASRGTTETESSKRRFTNKPSPNRQSWRYL